jgi:hypothetical protein
MSLGTHLFAASTVLELRTRYMPKLKKRYFFHSSANIMYVMNVRGEKGRSFVEMFIAFALARAAACWGVSDFVDLTFLGI